MLVEEAKRQVEEAKRAEAEANEIPEVKITSKVVIKK
jgi:hypothetical protein